MADINYILQDESNNDKKLIKELSQFIIDHDSKRLKIDKTFLTKITNIILSNYDVDYDCLKLISTKDDLGYWDCENNILLLDRNGLMDEARKYRKWFSHGNDRIYLYYNIINTIVHEITHAKQFALFNENKIYNSGYTLLEKNRNDYVAFYDSVLIERYAALRGNNIAYKTMSYVYPNDKIQGLKIFNFGYMFEGYKIINNGKVVNTDEDYVVDKYTEIIPPIETYNAVMKKNSIPQVRFDNVEDMDLYTRFYLGLKVSNLEYQFLSIIYNKTLNSIEPKEDLKRLINKFKAQKN